MAKKMYLSEEETAQRLGVSVEELDTLIRDDKLRVFQDGPNRMFKSDEVGALAGDEGGETAEPSQAEEEIELTPADTSSDTAHEPVSLSEAEKAPEGGKEDTVITAEGISIFDDEDLEIEAADPMAKTQIAPSLDEQMSLEGVGSGSGLLDLTRESDDTSLGAEVLDHIDVEEAIGSDIMPDTGGEPEETFAPQREVAAAAPRVVEEVDPSAGLFSGIVVGSAVVMCVLGSVVLAAMFGTVPSYLELFKEKLTLVLAGAAGVVAVAAVIGLLIGKAVYGRQMAMRQMGE